MTNHTKAVTQDAEAEERPWFGHLLNQIAGKFRSSTQKALQPLGISPPMVRALEALSADQPLTQVQLGIRVAMDRTTIVHLVDRFEELGYAQRCRSATDRRSHALMLTAEGEAALRKARTLARAVEDEVLASLTPAQRGLLLELLQAVHEPVNCPED